MKKIFINHVIKTGQWNFVEVDEEKKTSRLYATAKSEDEFDVVIDHLVEKGKI